MLIGTTEDDGRVFGNVDSKLYSLEETQLDEQVKKWTQLKTEQIPKLSELVKQANLPVLIIGEQKKTGGG